MKEIILLVAGLALGALGIYTFFCEKPKLPQVVDVTIVDQKLREIGRLAFAEKPEPVTAKIKIPKEFRWFNRVVAHDGVTIEASWTGIHLYAIDLKTQGPVFDNTAADTLHIKMPPYAHWVSYMEPGTVDFKTTDGSWFISQDDRYRIALQQIQAQNILNGVAYMERGRAELEQACIKAVTGIVYPHVKNAKVIKVDCPGPAKNS